MDTRNAASVALAESLGFERVGRTPGADHFKGSVSDEYRYELRVGGRPRNLEELVSEGLQVREECPLQRASGRRVRAAYSVQPERFQPTGLPERLWGLLGYGAGPYSPTFR